MSENPICVRCLFWFALQTVPSHNVGGRIRQIHPQNIMDQPRYCSPLQAKRKERHRPISNKLTSSKMSLVRYDQMFNLIPVIERLRKYSQTSLGPSGKHTYFRFLDMSLKVYPLNRVNSWDACTSKKWKISYFTEEEEKAIMLGMLILLYRNYNWPPPLPQ